MNLDEFIAWLRQHLAGGTPDLTAIAEQLDDLEAEPRYVEDSDLEDFVDAVIAATRRGDRHELEAEPLRCRCGGINPNG